MAYISVSDAVEKTGRGHTTIYRLCRRFERTNHIKREDRKFLIDEDFLTQQFTDLQNNETNTAAAAAAADSSDENQGQELVDMFIQELQNEKEYYRQLLDRKDEQLIKKDEIILKLHDRQGDLYQLLHHHTRLLDKLKNTEKEPLNVTDIKHESQQEPEEKKAEPAAISVYEAKVVYAVLAAAGFILFIAVIFADELRALAEN